MAYHKLLTVFLNRILKVEDKLQMETIYKNGDIIEVTETYGYAAVYNKKGQIVNSHIKNHVTKYKCEILDVKTERFYFGNGKYNKFQVAKLKYLDSNRIKNTFELINNESRQVTLYKRSNK